MLARVADLQVEIRGTPDAPRRAREETKATAGTQDRSSTIGVATVRGASAAGLAGIAVESGAALVVDRGGGVSSR
jgi:hypothetical protein